LRILLKRTFFCGRDSEDPWILRGAETLCHSPVGGGESVAKRGDSEFERVPGSRAEKIGRDGFTLLKSGGGSRSGTPSRSAPFERREKLGRWKGSPGAPVSGLFGGRKRKSERGRKKEETSSDVRRKKTWEALKLKRAGSPLPPEKGGRAGGCRWSREREPLERRDQADGSG
jgi:hypothetical protein